MPQETLAMLGLQLSLSQLLRSKASFVLSLFAVILASYLGWKQLKISKDQTELQKWMFKVESLKEEIRNVRSECDKLPFSEVEEKKKTLDFFCGKFSDLLYERRFDDLDKNK